MYCQAYLPFSFQERTSTGFLENNSFCVYSACNFLKQNFSFCHNHAPSHPLFYGYLTHWVSYLKNINNSLRINFHQVISSRTEVVSKLCLKLWQDSTQDCGRDLLHKKLTNNYHCKSTLSQIFHRILNTLQSHCVNMPEYRNTGKT